MEIETSSAKMTAPPLGASAEMPAVPSRPRPLLANLWLAACSLVSGVVFAGILVCTTFDWEPFAAEFTGTLGPLTFFASPDMFCGMASVSLVEWLTRVLGVQVAANSFGGTLAITLVQGGLVVLQLGLLTVCAMPFVLWPNRAGKTQDARGWN